MDTRFRGYDNEDGMTKRAQATIEFTFAMIAILLLIFGIIRIFRWVALDLADRRIAHDQLLQNTKLSPGQQITPNFYRPRKMEAVYNEFDFIK